MFVVGLLTFVKVLVVGFQRRATLPEVCPSDARISPVGSKWACTATMGQVSGAAHWPTTAGVVATTVTGTGALVVELLLKSRATAVSVWLPRNDPVVSQMTEYGSAGTSAPRG